MRRDTFSKTVVAVLDFFLARASLHMNSTQASLIAWNYAKEVQPAHDIGLNGLEELAAVLAEQQRQPFLALAFSRVYCTRCVEGDGQDHRMQMTLRAFIRHFREIHPDEVEGNDDMGFAMHVASNVGLRAVLERYPHLMDMFGELWEPQE
jgi:hypothetical protein